MNKREHAVVSAKIAGYHDDSAMFTRLIIECRVNRQVMNRAWFTGQKQKQNGVKCSCRDCNPLHVAA